MHRSVIVFGLYLSFAIAIGAACSAPAPLQTRDDDDTSSGNNTARGGSSNGGSVSNGGSISNNGGTTVANGGTTVANGGTTVANGGTTSGSAGTGGGTGGSVSNAGKGGGSNGGSGGSTMGGSAGMATGGSTATGGATSGSAGSGGGDVSCDAKFAVGSNGLVRAPMKGACWHGYASAGAGDSSALDGGTASTGMPTSFAMCGDNCMLKVAGTLAASDGSYAFLGFNVNELGSTKSTIKPTGTMIKVTFSKTGTFDVRLQISAGDTRWCSTVTSGTAIAWTSLKTECWGTTGKAYNMEAIDQLQLSVPGKAASTTAYDITLTSVDET